MPSTTKTKGNDKCQQKQQQHPRRIHKLLQECKKSGQRNHKKNNHTPIGLVWNEQRQTATTNQHCQLHMQTTPQMQRQAHNILPWKRTQTSQQNMQHCGSRSKRIIHVQTGRKNCKTGGNKQQSHVESSTQIQTGEQNQPQKNKNNGAQTTQWPKAKTDKENLSLFHPHCIWIFDDHSIVSPEALEFIRKRETYVELDNPSHGRNSKLR